MNQSVGRHCHWDTVEWALGLGLVGQILPEYLQEGKDGCPKQEDQCLEQYLVQPENSTSQHAFWQCAIYGFNTICDCTKLLEYYTRIHLSVPPYSLIITHDPAVKEHAL